LKLRLITGVLFLLETNSDQFALHARVSGVLFLLETNSDQFALHARVSKVLFLLETNSDQFALHARVSKVLFFLATDALIFLLPRIHELIKSLSNFFLFEINYMANYYSSIASPVRYRSVRD
jgi:uncharacterized membrane protein